MKKIYNRYILTLNLIEKCKMSHELKIMCKENNYITVYWHFKAFFLRLFNR